MASAIKPVSQTAFYCCGIRALDAAGRRICGDALAERCMTAEGWAVAQRFRRFHAANITNVMRHRLIDDLLQAHLARRPDATVILIGAGFDTRAFRLEGGAWVELEEPGLLELKEDRLPSGEAPNPLQRVPINFDQESLERTLLPFRDRSAPLVVVEGVLPYLSELQVRHMLQAIHRTFERPTLICDFTTRTFARRYYSSRLLKELRVLGAHFVPKERELPAIIEGEGFRLTACQSIIERAATAGYLPVPRWLLATLLRSLRDGYVLTTFEVTQPTGLVAGAAQPMHAADKLPGAPAS